MRKIKLTKEQLPKTNKETIKILRLLFENVSYNDINATTDEGAKKLLARWQLAEACLQKLEQPIKIVILEDIGENNYWRWYDIYRNITPQKAIKNYLKEMNLDGDVKLTPEDGYYYADEEDVRAIEYEI